MRYLAICDFEGTLTDNSGGLSASTCDMIRQFTRSNKLCILSYTHYHLLEDIWRRCEKVFDFFSLESGMGRIKEEPVGGRLEPAVLNSLLLLLGDWIYTAYAVNPSAVYIFRYRDRLEAVYPKGNRTEISALSQEVASCTLAVDTGGLSLFYRSAEENGLFYTVLAEDKKRQIIKISPKGFTKEDMLYKLNAVYPDCTTVGVGDSDTDYEYIRRCDIKIAMRNASAKLIEKCDYTTEEDNLRNGCMKELLKLK